MQLQQTAMAGTLESSDVLITLSPNAASGVRIEIDSKVEAQFGDSMRNTVTEVMKQFGIGLFSSDPAFIQTAVPCVRVFYGAFVFMALQTIGQNVHTALGKSKAALFFSLFRKVFLVLPLIYLFTDVFKIGVMGVFLSEPISEIIGGTAAFTVMRRIVRKICSQGKNEVPA